MRIEVRMFAAARDRAGAATVAVELPEGATVADLRRRLAVECAPLKALLTHSLFAVNDEFAEDGLALPLNATVALLPPVSGG